MIRRGTAICVCMVLALMGVGLLHQAELPAGTLANGLVGGVLVVIGLWMAVRIARRGLIQ